MRIAVDHTLNNLVRDTRKVATGTQAKMARVVRKNAEQCNRRAAGFARESAGAHGKHYYKAFSAEPITPLVWEVGPDASMPQGGMSFEWGSRNQPPHLDLNRSADIQAPQLGDDVRDLADRLFW